MTTLALDKSMRHKGDDGRLYVESSPISKACVSPYLGSEIPDSAMLGLDQNKVYLLLRDPVELAKAADSFRGLPVLITHKPTTANDHPKELTVGALGTDVVFNHPYLEAPLCIWTDEAIAGIETRTQVELSSGYRYTADMTPGTYEGMAYDGVMRNIQGNHVALVEVGRAGPDVVVADSNPFISRKSKMPTKKLRLSHKATAVNGALRAYLTPKLAQDAALGSLAHLLVDVKAATFAKQKAALLDKVRKHDAPLLAADAKTDDMEAAMDATDDEEAEDSDEDDEEEEKKKKAAALAQAADDIPDDAPMVKKAAMDSAIAAAVADSEKKVNALYQARKAVAGVCGDVALDSAEAVYKFALDHLGVDTTDVHVSAYPALLKLAADRKPAAAVAMDSATVKSTVAQFPNLTRFSHA
jgi:hypothetical protein